MQAISPSLYPLLRSIIDESYTDGIDRITSARENDDGTILAVGVDGTKQIACKISDENIKIRLLNPDAVSTKSAAFSSANIYEQLGMRLVELALEAEFAAPKKSDGKLKKKTCKMGLSCGGTCISKTKICARALSIDQQKQFKELKKRLKGGDVDAAKGIQELKDEQQGKPKSKATTEPKKTEPSKAKSTSKSEAKTAEPSKAQKSMFFDINDIKSNRPASDFDAKEIEDLADSIIASGGLYSPLLLKRSGEGYEVMDGHDLAYHAAARANKKDSASEGEVNGFVPSAGYEAGSIAQVKQLGKSDPFIESKLPTAKKKLSAVRDDKSMFVNVADIKSNRPASDFDAKEIESLADSILQNGGLLKPMVLVATGIGDSFNEQYAVVDGHLAYHASARAKQKDPDRAEEANGFVVSPGNIKNVTKQLALLK